VKTYRILCLLNPSDFREDSEQQSKNQIRQSIKPLHYKRAMPATSTPPVSLAHISPLHVHLPRRLQSDILLSPNAHFPRLCEGACHAEENVDDEFV
jgi:hypothetical protein